MKSFTWKNVGIVVAAFVGVFSLSSVALPLLQSDAPPWASRRTVGETAKMVRESISDLKADIIAARLFNYRREQCKAIRSGDMRLAATIGNQIQSTAAEYFATTGQVFDLRPCDEF
jgi:hypothetical protein